MSGRSTRLLFVWYRLLNDIGVLRKGLLQDLHEHLVDATVTVMHLFEKVGECPCERHIEPLEGIVAFIEIVDEFCVVEFGGSIAFALRYLQAQVLLPPVTVFIGDFRMVLLHSRFCKLVDSIRCFFPAGNRPRNHRQRMDGCSLRTKQQDHPGEPVRSS